MAEPIDFERLAAEVEERPSVCGVIEDDVTCTTAPAWRSVSECCGWSDVACDAHRTALDASFQGTELACGNCGHRVVLRWSPLIDALTGEAEEDSEEPHHDR